MSDYDGLIGRSLRKWDDNGFENRKKKLATVWSNISKEEKKALIALLVAHAPESCTETDLSVADRKVY
jgi:hypothetical protein